MKLEDTRLAAEVTSVRELNLYLQAGWVLIQTYVKHASDSQQPRFILGWQSDGSPVRPELLDEWEQREVRRSEFR